MIHLKANENTAETSKVTMRMFTAGDPFSTLMLSLSNTIPLLLLIFTDFESTEILNEKKKFKLLISDQFLLTHPFSNPEVNDEVWMTKLLGINGNNEFKLTVSSVFPKFNTITAT